MNPQSRIGQTLKERYRLEAIVGQGGMSTVFQGYDPHLNRPVAVKIIHSYLALHEKFLQRFQQEATAMARLRHPNIVQVYDFDHEDDVYYMVMEFVDGVTLQQQLHQLLKRPAAAAGGTAEPTLGTIATTMMAICDAVEFAHRQNMIHRDLKPANIMLRIDGSPVLMDFGIAKLVDQDVSLTNTGAVMGTVAYMSPEQVKGEDIDHRADIYALGVIFYELLTGRRPYDAETQFATMMKHLHDPVPNLLDTLKLEDPRQRQKLSDLVDRAMAKDKTKRFQSAAAMRDALDALLHLPNSDLTTVLERNSAAASSEAGTTSGLRAVLSPQDRALRELDQLTAELAQDPLQEEKQRQMMMLLGRQGEFLSALKQYQHYQKLLQADLGVEPAAGTVRLREQLITARMTPEHNLQPDVTPFVGREAEIRQFVKLLRDPQSRLITIQGSGGMGKTRLARAVMRQINSRQWRSFLHGCYFVPLAAVEPSTTGALVSALAEACDIALTGQSPPESQLLNFFQQREALLVFDNFEHLVDQADFVYQLLEGCPQLKGLVTSRQRLNLPGETIFPLGGLRFGSKGSEERGTLSLDDGSRLFLQAGRKLNPDFRLNDEDQRSVNQICALVDGMPLGIELAASWTPLLSCTEIAVRLSGGLDLLSTDQSQIPARHRDLRAVFNYSWELLAPAEQQLLSALSVFRAQFEFTAAQAVSGAQLAVIRSLVEKSLLQAVLVDEKTLTPLQRVYTLHETVRRYAAEKLTHDPERAAAIAGRHVAFFTSFLAEQRVRLRGHGQREAWEAISRNLDDVRQAWQAAVRRGRITAVERALVPLHLFFKLGGLYLAGAQLFENALDQLPPHLPETLRYRLQGRLVDFYVRLGRFPEAEAICNQWLAIWETLEKRLDARELPFLLGVLGEIYWRQGHYAEAQERSEKALQLFEANRDDYGRAAMFNQIGVIHYLQGDYETAYQQYAASLEQFEKLGDEINAARIRANLALYQVAMRQFEAGIEGLLADLEVARRWQNKSKMAVDLLNLAWAELSLKHYDEAQRYIDESQVYYQEIGDQEGVATALIIQGQLAWEQQQIAIARRHFLQGLQLALGVQAMPKALECIASLAIFLIEDSPTQAWVYCRFVYDHPQASQIAQLRAQGVLDRLKGHIQDEQISSLRLTASLIELEQILTQLSTRFG